MLNSWLSSKTTDRKASGQHQANDKPGVGDTPKKDDADTQASARPSLDRAVTAGITTPHDTILAELYGRHAEDASKADVEPPASTAPKMSTVPSAATSERGDHVRNATASPPPQGVRSGAATPAPEPGAEPLYDPVTGQLAGIMLPAPGSPPDELWSQLARIRELQNEIAGMHLQMEGIGPTGETRGTRRAPTPAGMGMGKRVHSDTIGGVEEWEAAASESAENRKAARDAEFVNLAEMFKGRKAAIDSIMEKLDELSESLTRFHALPTPAMDFANSRQSTAQSGMTSPAPNDSDSRDNPAPMPPVRRQDTILTDSPISIHPADPIAASSD